MILEGALIFLTEKWSYNHAGKEGSLGDGKLTKASSFQKPFFDVSSFLSKFTEMNENKQETMLELSQEYCLCACAKLLFWKQANFPIKICE